MPSVKTLTVLGVGGFLTSFIVSLIVAMFFTSYATGVIVGVVWLLGSAAFFFFAFWHNEDMKKKIAYCIIGASSVIGAITMIAVDAQRERDTEKEHYYGWHIENTTTLATFVYCIVMMCFGEVLATALAFVGTYLGLDDLFSAAGFDKTMEIGIFSGINLLFGFLGGIAFGQGKKKVHVVLGGFDHNRIWKTGFCYTIALWFFSAGAYVGLAFLLEKRGGGATGLTDPMATPAYDAGESKGGYTSIN